LRGQKNIFHNIDWITVFLYLTLVFLGWINIYAAVYDDSHKSIFDISQRYGKQLIWIAAAIILGLIILIIDAKFFSTFAYPIYIISILSLLAVLLLGTRIAGSKSWFQIGGFGIQPAEFAKFATNLAIAKYLTTLNIDLKKLKTIIKSLLIIGIPAILILLQHDMGSALVYSCFILVLYREGLSGSILILGVMIMVLFILTLVLGKFIFIGILAGIAFLMFFFIKRNIKNIYSIIGILLLSIAFVFSVDYGFENVLQAHQKKRIEVLLGKEADLKGAGYNVNQSKIAIGSGGFSGKGFLKGTQTKYNFVPEQSTDFIFCTVGEEWGFVGSFVVIFLFIALLIRLIKLAERQRSAFSRIYGYGVASILFFHVVVNIGMTIGLTPVIGIPLPFFSYGGSSLWAFTILLFIFLKQDANRLEVL
jgi:rod shape determining protein RodA